jgi:hypothetical protein
MPMDRGYAGPLAALSGYHQPEVEEDSSPVDRGYAASADSVSPRPNMHDLSSESSEEHLFEHPSQPTHVISRDKSGTDIVKTEADLQVLVVVFRFVFFLKKKKKISFLQFNDDWQKAIEKLSFVEEGNVRNYEVLAELSRNFVAMAQTYGRIIVRELHYAPERKLIKPMDLGGVIGGEKFVRSGILFKGG